MIKVCKGDILDTSAKVIVNPVDCFGWFSGELASRIKEKWPMVYQEYARVCDREYDYPIALLGSTLIVSIGKRYIANCFAESNQIEFGDGLLEEDFKKGLAHIRDFAEGISADIAIECNAAKNIIYEVFADYGGTVMIYRN